MKDKKKILQMLIQDCIIFRLNFIESREYLEKNNVKVSERHFYRIKKFIESDQNLQHWFNNHTKIGFMLEHKKRIDEIESVLGYLMKIFQTESKKENHNIVIKLSERIESLNKRLSELYLGNPIISEIKKEVEIRNGEDSNRDQSGTKINTPMQTDQNRIF